MKTRLFVLLIALLALTACETAAQPTATDTVAPAATSAPSPTAAPAAPTPLPESLIMLRDPLDEPEFYCVDVAGFGSNLNLNAPLQAHTCKPGADDELFIFNAPAPGQFTMDAYDVCLEAGEGVLFVKACSDSEKQLFEFTTDGVLRLQGSNQCVAVQSGSGQPAGGRSHVRRDLLLLACADVAPNLSRWALPGTQTLRAILTPIATTQLS